MTELPVDQVRTLLAVAEHGTFDAAAGALHVTPSAISQRVKALEQRTGRVLLMRTKPVRLTESGEVVVRFARQLAQLEHDTRTELGMAEPARLSIAVNADSLATWFMPALAAAPEGFCFELHREDEGHTTKLLREGTVMAAITSSPEPVTGCTVRPLGLLRYYAVASPDFVARWLSGPLRQALPQAPVIVFDRSDQLQDEFVRKLTRGTPASSLRHYVPIPEGFCAAIAAGLGWGLSPLEQAATLLDSGALVHLAEDRPIDVPLFWQQWKLDSPALATVADLILDAAAHALIR